MRKILILSLALGMSACTTSEDTTDAPSKERARDAQAKSDATDFCELYGWYGDGICDGFCLQPDPDCEPEPDAENCGGQLGLTCDDDKDYCHYDESQMCGAADHLGTCTPKPIYCPAVIDPVCGCDNVTYQNACQANSEGMSVVSSGPCPEPACNPDLICGQAITCVDGQFYPTTCGPANCDAPLGPCNVDPQPTCDPTMVCTQVLTCVDGQLYPTGCGPANCDEPIGPCDPEPTCDPTMICTQALTCVDGQLYPTGCGPANCDAPIGPCDDGATCQGACGGQAAGGSCYCDAQCEQYGDCCDDYAAVCQ